MMIVDIRTVWSRSMPQTGKCCDTLLFYTAMNLFSGRMSEQEELKNILFCGRPGSGS